MSVERIDKKAIAKSFGKAASHYDSVAHFQRWVGDQLLTKISVRNVNTVVDLGCGTGFYMPALQSQFPDASVYGLDLSEDMVLFAKGLRNKASLNWLVGDAESLPFKTGSVDVIFSNLSVQWCGSLESLFLEISRVLSKDGVFVFSSLVDGSLSELKQAWLAVDDQQHVNAFAQKQDYQQAIIASSLDVMNLDIEEKILRYQKVKDLTQELKTLGAHNMTSHRPSKMTGKSRIRHFLSAYENFRQDDGFLPASYQVLWGTVGKLSV